MDTVNAVLRISRRHWLFWGILGGSWICFAWFRADLFASPPQSQDLEIVRLNKWIFYIGLAFIIFALPISLFRRMQIYKRGWNGLSIDPKHYLRGQDAFFTCLPAFGLGTHFVVHSGNWDWLVGPATIVFIVFFAANYPSIKPMLSASPRLGERKKDH